MLRMRRTRTTSDWRRTAVLLFAAAAAHSVRAAELAAEQTSFPFWIEAEDYAAQHGSGASRYMMTTASAGACVDNGWGGKSDHLLRYDVLTPADCAKLVVGLRYARHMPGDAVVRISLDDKPAKGVTVRLPSTGDWGFSPDGWRYAWTELPAMVKGKHTIEIRSLAEQNNVNFDGFYLNDTVLAHVNEPPRGPEEIAALDPKLDRLPCKTPLALPLSRQKAYVTGSGAVQSLSYREDQSPGRAGRTGPMLEVMLAGRGAWRSVTQSIELDPVTTVVTRLEWPDIIVEQSAWAAAPEKSGFWVRVKTTNGSQIAQDIELVSLLRNARGGEMPLLRLIPTEGVETTTEPGKIPGPLGDGRRLTHRMRLAPRQSREFDLQFLGDGTGREECLAKAVETWRETLAPVRQLKMPDAMPQRALDVSLRQMLAMIEPRDGHLRVLKGLEHYYGANPYDTFQVSRALDAAGLKDLARELLRHQIAHLKDDGLFEMWETGNLTRKGADQWIVQGLAAAGLWGHFKRHGDEAWLREITPVLIKAARATLRLRREQPGPARQGAVEIVGWLPPIGGDGGLGVGCHWSQNAGPLSGVRIAAEAARRLNLPEAVELEAGAKSFQKSFDAVRRRAVDAAGSGMIPAFPGATGNDRERPLWGVVMSVTTFDAIPHDDPAAVATLRFLQAHQRDGLHLNLGYSRGVWPYLSAEVALWHLRLGEREEAWRILRAMAARASSTVCWYEEFDPGRGHGDPFDVWAAAEMVYLSSRLAAKDCTPTITAPAENRMETDSLSGKSAIRIRIRGH